MNKNYLFHLTRCAVFLFIGARIQNAKAVYPDPDVVQGYWRQNPKIFQKTLKKLFPKAEQLPLWSAEFPDWFKEQNGKLYEIRMGSDYSSFHTLDDLGKLLCDADLKKIVRALGSSKFLKNVLPKEVAESIFAHATSGNGEFKTEVEFRPNFKDAFFNMFGRGALEMSIKQCHNDSQVLTCNFSFVFEKKNNFTVLKNCYATYETQGGNPVSVELLKKRKSFRLSVECRNGGEEEIPACVCKIAR